jgi:hypothetical protein
MSRPGAPCCPFMPTSICNGSYEPCLYSAVTALLFRFPKLAVVPADARNRGCAGIGQSDASRSTCRRSMMKRRSKSAEMPVMMRIPACLSGRHKPHPEWFAHSEADAAHAARASGPERFQQERVLRTMRKKRALQQTERQLSAAKRVLQRERRIKERTSGKLAKQNAKRSLKTLRQGVEFLKERREALKEAR